MSQSGSILSIAGGLSVAGAAQIVSTTPTHEFFETDGSADNKYWRWYVDAEVFNLQTVNDAHSLTSTVLSSTRAGIVNFHSGRVGILGVSPTLDFYESDQGADLKYTRWIMANTQILLQSVNDAYSAATTLLLITRATGDLSVLGTVTAPLFSGSGASLTTLNASNLASGDVPAARIAARSLADLGTRSAGDLSSGTLLSGRMPALTGDVTSGVGTVATTLASGSASVLNSGNLAYARMPSGSGTWTAVPTISGAVTLQSTLGVTGTATFTAHANPAINYTSNLGSLGVKYLTLHAAELWVETLVAQNTMATIGGRVLVAPTNILSADLAAAGTTITVKYNNFLNGSRIYLEADGKLEWMAVTSSAGGSAGAYTYTVTRNLDGSGANDWFAGDAALNTGTTGNGFIDLYSTAGVFSGTGPTIVGNVRTGTTYNQVAPRWAIGNLDGIAGVSGSLYGAFFGDSTASNLIIDATNGIRIRNSTTVFAQLAAGVFTLGLPSGNRVGWDGTNLTLISPWVTIDADGLMVGDGTSAGSFVTQQAVNFRRPSGFSVTRFSQTDAVGMWVQDTTHEVVIGDVIVPASAANHTARVTMRAQGWKTTGDINTDDAEINLISGPLADSNISISAQSISINSYTNSLALSGDVVDVSGRIIFSANNYANVDASLAKNATYGLIFQGATGSSYDFALLAAGGGADILRVTTGTSNVVFPSGTLSVTTGVVTFGNGLVMSGGDIIPTTDNTVSVGLAANRFTLVRAVTITPGDVRFDNGWTLTEHDRIGVNQPGLALLDDTGMLVAFFGRTQTYCKPWADIDELPHHLTTSLQRSKMDRAPTTRIVGYRRDATQSPIYGTVADVAFPDPGTAQSTRQRGGGQ